jgi:XTP/dITP diphosphohydrolase
MKKLLIASNNPNKIREIKQILNDETIEVLTLNDVGLMINPEENGSTFTENALIKARTVYDVVKIPVLADDSGIIVDELGNLPGVFSKRFAGEKAFDDDNNKKVADELRALNLKESDAKFICSMAFIDLDGTEHTFEGECKGVFILEPRGLNGFGYDPYFFLPKFNSTMAELSETQKNAVSHRGKALQKFAAFLRSGRK